MVFLWNLKDKIIIKKIAKVIANLRYCRKFEVTTNQFTMSNLQQLSLQFEQEIWKDVKGFEGRFSISSFGRLMSHNGRLKGSHILTPAIDILGYYMTNLRSAPVNRKVRIHTLVAENFLINPHLSVRQTVNHIDGNKLNNRVDNLEWISAAENCAHAVRIGLYDIKGSKHPAAKVNENEVLEMRSLSDNECVSARVLAISYGLSRRNVNDIVKRRLWNHV